MGSRPRPDCPPTNDGHGMQAGAAGDVLFGYRLQLFDYAARTSVSEACRMFGTHPSTAGKAALAGCRVRSSVRAAAGPSLERRVEAERSGELVGLDCFFVGRLSGAKGRVWQLTAVDVSCPSQSNRLPRLRERRKKDNR